MSVLVLMYHRTQASGADGLYDVSLSRFRDQISALEAAGCRFIRFSEALDPRCYGSDVYVSITFDDGHRSNAAAVEHLAMRGVTPSLFIVSDWSRTDPDHLSASDIAGLGSISEFGGHGATHTAMTRLPADRLEQELRDSKAYLEDTLGRATTAMAFPGGWFDRTVVRAARQAGFSMLGDSIPLINQRPMETVHRVVIRNDDTAARVARLARARPFYWALLKARREATGLAAHLLGAKTYDLLSNGVKRVLR